jgi:hypothetical protein
MLKDIIAKEQEKRKSFQAEQRVHFDLMAKNIIKLKKHIDKKSNGILKLELANMVFSPSEMSNGSYPKIVIQRPCLMNIHGSVESFSVGGFQLFPLMGEKHTVESFFKKIAPYL